MYTESLSFFFLLFIAPSLAKLPCEYLSMVDGNLVLDPGTKLCLGNCPSQLNGPGIYIGSSQTLFFPSFRLLTSGGSGNTLSLQRNDGTAVLTCDQRSCYAATIPANANALDPGFYLTGRPGSPPLSINDPWQVLSNIDLVDGSKMQMIQLQQGYPGAEPVTGWRLVVGNTSYAMTNRNQLVVGNVLASTILATNNNVLAEGPVLVRNAQKACPIPLPRPTNPSAVLIYSPIDPTLTTPICNFSADPRAFTYTVPVNTCLASPFSAIASSPIAYDYFQIVNTQLRFYSDSLCTKFDPKSSIILAAPCTKIGWSAIFLAPNPNMVL